MGTSLKIPGVKRLVRELSKCVKASTSGVHKLGAAKSLLINCGTPTSFAGWDSVFDYFVDGPSDVVVDMLGCPIYSELANKPESRDSASQQRPKPKRTRSVKRKTLSEDDTENASSHDGSVKNNDGAGGDDDDDDDDIPLSLQTLVSGNSPYCEFDPSLYSNDTFVNLFSDATTLSDLYSSDFELLGSEL
ncbi:hypothetical protein AX774_g914 [Zancudomyces culisetae]|uniref:Uncharacterized protein n=1 Tax=Zancudomyces culisetae TaxID=1213189 RepID=A0A1R1PX09_ZANCU|nr:hypothetical protein AX774_g914 [Zancudomyces culisetae]|eukprot:OMH85525.1 hypothetical protein AX774_g914 [Zancudomyces culisetae]